MQNLGDIDPELTFQLVPTPEVEVEDDEVVEGNFDVAKCSDQLIENAIERAAETACREMSRPPKNTRDPDERLKQAKTLSEYQKILDQCFVLRQKAEALRPRKEKVLRAG